MDTNISGTMSFPVRSSEFTRYVDCQNWVRGAWQPPHNDEWMEILNPRHGKAMGRVAMSSSADVDAAVAAARDAFPEWRAMPLKERTQILFRMKALMERDIDELSWILDHENGKTFPQAKAEVLKAIECLEYGLSVQNLGQGAQLDVSRGIRCDVTYEPLGVCAGIVPFNFPTMVPMWMLPQALVSGNTFVMKPSEQTPYGCLKIAELFQEAGLPAGVLNFVNGGQAAVEALVDHADVKAVGFVGSTRVAKLVYARAAAQGKRSLCLGGAKNHLLVVPDADVELTAETIVASAYGCAGQRCMAASVMVAVGDVSAIIERMVAKIAAMQLGRDMGAIIHQASQERIEKYITDAETRGAKLLCDGRGARPVDGEAGYWVGPTLLDNVGVDWPAGCEEIFGPVLSIVRANTLDEAIAIENANAYGNAASIFTTSGAVARYAMERVNAGMCGVNIGVPVPREPFSFGGWNDSKFGHGDMTGYDGYRFWTRPRKVTSRWEIAKDATWMS